MIKTVACAAFSLLVMFFTPALAEDTKMTRAISLNGHGEVHMAPDMAIVTVGVISTAPTAREALTANTKSMEAIFAALKSAGIDARDMQTSNFMVNPRYDYGQNTGQAPKLMGYDVSNNVTITIRKLDNLGAVLDQVVTSGSNQVNGVVFQVSHPETATDEARKLAFADALRKAKVYASASGITLGNVLNVTEGVGYQPPVPMYAKTMRAEASADVPIAQGEQTISIDVNVSWEIK